MRDVGKSEILGRGGGGQFIMWWPKIWGGAVRVVQNLGRHVPSLPPATDTPAYRALNKYSFD